jgi:hypothetical protein
VLEIDFALLNPLQCWSKWYFLPLGVMYTVRWLSSCEAEETADESLVEVELAS